MSDIIKELSDIYLEVSAEERKKEEEYQLNEQKSIEKLLNSFVLPSGERLKFELENSKETRGQKICVLEINGKKLHFSVRFLGDGSFLLPLEGNSFSYPKIYINDLRGLIKYIGDKGILEQ